jgi:ABC-2 type transport system permease protein
MKTPLGSASALRRFGFKQSLKGAIIVGVLAGFMTFIQGVAYAASFPDEKSRMQLASSLEGAPALGILYGEIKDLDSPVGYMVYRVVTFMSLIVAIWGIAVATRLLRGQEEDGRWEMILSGNTSARRASWNVFLGFIGAFIVAFIISTLITFSSGLSKDIDISLATSALINLAIFLPGLVFAGLGVLTSQLSVMRRRAFMYGLILLLACFIARGLGNTIADLSWLMNISPFGWSELINPIGDVQLSWIITLLSTSIVFVLLGIYLVGKRDVYSGILRESTTVKPKFALLGSPTAFAIRQNLPQFIGWTLLAIFISSVIVAVTNIAVDAMKDAPGLATAISQIGGSFDDLKVAFVGTGMIFTAVILLIMASVNIANIRSDEAKNYLDTILTQPIRRSTWLINRLVVTIAALTIVSLICAFFTYAIATSQGIPLEFGNFILVNLALVSTSVFLLGVGTFLYGFWPRVAAAFMYAVVAWSFIIETLGSAVKLDDRIVNSSLFHYISQSPTKAPDWSAFAWLVVLGVGLAAIGIVKFTKRDIISE